MRNALTLTPNHSFMATQALGKSPLRPVAGLDPLLGPSWDCWQYQRGGGRGAHWVNERCWDLRSCFGQNPLSKQPCQ